MYWDSAKAVEPRVKVKGKHTPLDLYTRLHGFRPVPVVFDDLDDLIRKPENVMMLKCICETSPVKRVEWEADMPPSPKDCREFRLDQPSVPHF